MLLQQLIVRLQQRDRIIVVLKKKISVHQCKHMTSLYDIDHNSKERNTYSNINSEYLTITSSVFKISNSYSQEIIDLKVYFSFSHKDYINQSLY